MNAYLCLSNFIKDNLSNDWMTPSQERAYDELVGVLPCHSYVNLYGTIGSGKTFLGWLLHKNRIGDYFTHITSLKSTAEMIVVDNVTARREDFRRLVREAQLANIHKLVAISREPIDDYVVPIRLDCQPVDLKKVAHNLYEDQTDLNFGENRNLWELYHLLIALKTNSKIE